MRKASDANLYKRGKTWWIAYRGVRRSLQTRNLGIARDARDKEVERIDRELRGLERFSWEFAVGEWLAHAPSQIAASTLARYKLSLKVTAPILAPLMLDEITRESLARIARRADVTNATRRRDLTAVASVLDYAVDQGWLAEAPRFNRRSIRERRDPITLPSPSEVERFAHACPGVTLPWMVRLLRRTGMRLEEAASLEWRQVDLARRTIKLEKTKGNRIRTIPLSDAAVQILAHLPRQVGTAWVFWHAGRDRYHHLDTYLMKVRRKLGIRWRTHDLRHMFAVEYLQGGGSLYQLQQILGHVTIRTTEMYLDHLTPEEADRAKGVG